MCWFLSRSTRRRKTYQYFVRAGMLKKNKIVKSKMQSIFTRVLVTIACCLSLSITVFKDTKPAVYLMQSCHWSSALYNCWTEKIIVAWHWFSRGIRHCAQALGFYLCGWFIFINFQTSMKTVRKIADRLQQIPLHPLNTVNKNTF